MASHNLLDLVCQLQTFETKISEIVMEMAVKLCALNDTKLFVVLSTSTGRKVVGSPDLCNQFFQQQLRTDGTESYLEFDHNRNVMMEVPIPGFERNMPVFPGAFQVGGGGGNGRKRSMDDGGSGDAGHDRKSPRMDSYGAGGIESQFEAWDTEDAECCVVDVEDSSTSGGGSGVISPPSAHSSSALVQNSNGARYHHSTSSLFTKPQHHQQRVPVQISRQVAQSKNPNKAGNPDYEIPEAVRVGMNAFMADNQFAHALLDCDGLNVVSRDTKEHKVLTTLIMQFAKYCSPHCPVDKPDKTAFANMAFEIFWQNCVNLHEFENYVVNNGHQNYSMR